MTASHYSLSNVRKAIFHYVVGRGGGGLAALVSVVLLVKYMDTVDYAGYIAMTSLVMLVASMSSLGLERASARFVPDARMHRDPWELLSFVRKLAYVRITIALVAASALTFLWPWISKVFSQAIVQPIIPWQVPLYLIATTVFSYFSVVLQSLLEQRTLTRLILVQTVGRLVLIVVLISIHRRITLEQSLWVMVIPELVAAASAALVTFLMLRRNNTSFAQSCRQWPEWREVWHIAFHSYGFNVLASLPQGYFMRLLIAATFPVHITAAYGFFSSLVDRLGGYLPMRFMYNLLEPVMIANYLANHDRHELARRSQGVYKGNVLVLLSALIVVALLGKPLVALLTGGKYVAEYWMLALLLVQLTIASHVVALQLFFNTLKATHLLSLSGLGALVVMILGLVLSYAAPSGYWLLTCPILYEVAMNVIAVSLAKKNSISYALQKGGFLKIGLLCLVLTLAAKALLNQFGGGLQVQLLMSLAAVGLFLIGSFKLGAITNNEITMVKRLVGRR